MKPLISICSIVAFAASAAVYAQTLTFAAPKQISTGVSGSEIADTYLYGNFEGNGNTDLIVKISGSGTTIYKTLKGDGTGNFTNPTTISLGQQTNALVADVNGDGKDDIITLLPGCNKTPCDNNPANPGDLDGVLTVLLSNGDLTFTPGYTATLPANLNAAEGIIGDFNKDGKPDIAVLAFSTSTTYYPDGQLIIFLSQGDGTFAETAYQVPIDPNAIPTNLVTGDFEGSGNQDLAFVFNSEDIFPPLLFTFAGDGIGHFAPPKVSYTFNSGFILDYPQHTLNAADLNGDGLTDLIINLTGPPGSFHNPGRVPSLLAKKSGGFYWHSAISFSQLPPSVVLLADMNGDGKPDLVFAEAPNVPPVQFSIGGVYLGLGNGAFKTPHIPITFSIKNYGRFPDIAAVPLKTGDLPSLIIDNNVPSLELLINTTK